MMLRTTGLLAGLFVSTIASAAHADDVQAWNVVNVNVALKDGYALSLEGQARLTEDASHLGQIVFRPSVSLKLKESLVAAVGYAYVENRPEGSQSSSEQRLWQQIIYTPQKTIVGFSLSTRSRLEQRWPDGSDETGWRLRQQVRLTKPVSASLKAFVWSEAFLGLNETGWGQSRGLDRWRNAVGVTIPVGDRTTIEPSYINQRVYRPGPDRSDHILGLTLNTRF